MQFQTVFGFLIKRCVTEKLLNSLSSNGFVVNIPLINYSAFLNFSAD